MKLPENRKLQLGIVGLGAIGSFLIDNLKEEKYIQVIAGADTSQYQKEKTAEKHPELFLTDDYHNFPDDTDVIVEAAHPNVSDEIAHWAIERGKAVIIASVGGLGDIRPLRRLARKTGGHLYIPSGAIAGLDALKAIPSRSIRSVSITTTKNPSKFSQSSYVKEQGIDLSKINSPTVIFDGTAGEAVKAFPRNINVSAILSYAGIGRSHTQVTIMADPHIKVNQHKICIESDHGRVQVQVDNVAFEINPRTSKLAAFSILAAIKSLVYTITIG